MDARDWFDERFDRESETDDYEISFCAECLTSYVSYEIDISPGERVKRQCPKCYDYETLYRDA
jgi:hypothetical protein